MEGEIKQLKDKLQAIEIVYGEVLEERILKKTELWMVLVKTEQDLLINEIDQSQEKTQDLEDKL